MAIETAAHRLLRYAGSDCSHDLLLKVVRPSYPNHDGGAEAAAYAFQESAFGHLIGWFERWRLPPLCRSEHSRTVVRDFEDGEPVEGPGFRWVMLAGVRTYLLTDSGADGDLRDS